MVLIPTPSHTEQLNNAYRVQEMGVAKVLEQHAVNKETLEAAIKEMLTEEGCRKKIEKIQTAVSGLNGLQTAVETIINVARNN